MVTLHEKVGKHVQQVVLHTNNVSVRVCTSCTSARVATRRLHVCGWLVPRTRGQQAGVCQDTSACRVSHANVRAHAEGVVRVQVFPGHVSQ